jgi:hypothetical protein
MAMALTNSTANAALNISAGNAALNNSAGNAALNISAGNAALNNSAGNAAFYQTSTPDLQNRTSLKNNKSTPVILSPVVESAKLPQTEHDRQLDLHLAAISRIQQRYKFRLFYKVDVIRTIAKQFQISDRA